MKRVCLTIVAALVMATLAGCGSSSGGSSSAAATPTATAVATLKIGDALTKGNWQYQVSRAAQTRSLTLGPFGGKADAKGIWTVAQLKIQNVGKETLPINAWDFEVKDSADITYKADETGSRAYSDFLKLSKPGDNFPPGVPAEIALIFDTNPAAAGLKLRLAQADTLVDLGTMPAPAAAPTLQPPAAGASLDDVDSMISQGNRAYDEGRWSEAATWYERILEKRPGDTNVRTDLGTAYFYLGLADKSKEQWLKVLDQDPSKVQTHYNLGVLYASQNPPDRDSAAKEWQTVIKIAPNSEQASQAQQKLKSLGR